MKYWRGYLVAAIFAAISWALVQFAKAHSVLVDMVYPYVTRMFINSMADWTGSMSVSLWQVLMIGLIAAGLASIVLMVVLRWNPIQWFGWVMAAVMCISMCNTVVYGLNEYSSPLADDIRLNVTDYTVSELNEATLFFRDKVNEMAKKVSRDHNGDPRFPGFEELTVQAAEGYKSLTYDKAISVFSGSTAPVKEQTWFKAKGDSGITIPLTGEAAVNPDVPIVSKPFAICKEMAHRMSIYSDADANFAAFMACTNNSSEAFEYSAYLMAYYYCYEALASIPTSTAQACAKQTDGGVNQLLRNDLQDIIDFYGHPKLSGNRKVSTDPTEPEGGEATITFAEYTDVSDLLASWYIQEYIVPTYQEEEAPFDPYDPTQVDLSGIVNVPTEG